MINPIVVIIPDGAIINVFIMRALDSLFDESKASY